MQQKKADHLFFSHAIQPISCPLQNHFPYLLITTFCRCYHISGAGECPLSAPGPTAPQCPRPVRGSLPKLYLQLRQRSAGWRRGGLVGDLTGRELVFYLYLLMKISVLFVV